MFKFFLTVAAISLVVASGVSASAVLTLGAVVAGGILVAAFVLIRPPVVK